MANQVITAMSSVFEVEIPAVNDEIDTDTPDVGNQVPIEFRIEITPDGKLGPITATDREGNRYGISLKLTTSALNICCCFDDGKGRVVCTDIGNALCSCDPV